MSACIWEKTAAKNVASAIIRSIDASQPNPNKAICRSYVGKNKPSPKKGVFHAFASLGYCNRRLGQKLVSTDST